jgi:CheY-like chemotaxis protein
LSQSDSRRILLATTPASAAMLAEILGATHELILTTTLDHAHALLGNGIDVIACDSHFDDCRMFDLLRLAKSNPATRPIPFLCLRLVEGALDQTLYQSVSIASTALGAAGFIDMFDTIRKSGQRKAHEKLNGLIDQLAASRDDF